MSSSSTSLERKYIYDGMLKVTTKWYDGEKMPNILHHGMLLFGLPRIYSRRRLHIINECDEETETNTEKKGKPTNNKRMKTKRRRQHCHNVILLLTRERTSDWIIFLSQNMPNGDKTYTHTHTHTHTLSKMEWKVEFWTIHSQHS